jgi:hypothetical protein
MLHLNIFIIIITIIICKKTDISNKDKITLIGITQLYLFLHLLNFAWLFTELLLV